MLLLISFISSAFYCLCRNGIFIPIVNNDSTNLAVNSSAIHFSYLIHHDNHTKKQQTEVEIQFSLPLSSIISIEVYSNESLHLESLISSRRIEDNVLLFDIHFNNSKLYIIFDCLFCQYYNHTYTNSFKIIITNTKIRQMLTNDKVQFEKLAPWKETQLKMTKDSQAYFKYSIISSKPGIDLVMSFKQALNNLGILILIFTDDKDISDHSRAIWNSNEKDKGNTDLNIALVFSDTDKEVDALYLVFELSIDEEYQNTFSLISKNEYEILPDGKAIRLPLDPLIKVYRYEINKSQFKNMKVIISHSLMNGVTIHIMIEHQFGECEPLINKSTVSIFLYYNFFI